MKHPTIIVVEKTRVRTKVLIGCFAGLMVLDLALTQTAATAGRLTEGNPLMGYILGQSWLAAWALKVSVTAIAVVGLLWLSRRHSNLTGKLLAVLVACMTGVCLVNWLWLQ